MAALEPGRRETRAHGGGWRAGSGGVDRRRASLYIFRMDSAPANTSSERDIQLLERRVEALIHTCEELRVSNRTLREREQDLVAERSRLIEKTERARTRVEAMILRLKAMEDGL